MENLNNSTKKNKGKLCENCQEYELKNDEKYCSNCGAKKDSAYFKPDKNSPVIIYGPPLVSIRTNLSKLVFDKISKLLLGSKRKKDDNND